MGKGRVKRVFRAMIGLMLAGVLLMIGLMLAGVLLLFTPKLILWSDRLSPGDRVIVMDGCWVVLDGHIPGATRESVRLRDSGHGTLRRRATPRQLAG